jgi:hypothetical protein
MKVRHWKYPLALSCSLLVNAVSIAAQQVGATNSAPEKARIVYLPVRDAERGNSEINRLLATATNLVNHLGPTITSAKVVLIFWGPSFANVASPDYSYAQAIISFRNQLGTTPEYNTITEYSGIQLVNLGSGTSDWFDTSTPPVNVSDAAVRSKVNQYLASHSFDASTIYEVFLPSTSYSSNGSQTSCGGPNLTYCAYHSWIGSGAAATKYSIQPYPSCGGCQVAGWTAAQNQEHFITHETRETVTDATLTAWFDSSGAEADDKCAWSPPPFIGTGGYGYQFEWSNAAGGCISSKTAPTLTMIHDHCYGSNSAEWTAPSGATSYELWASASSAFSSPYLSYSGPDTFLDLNVGATTYFHVRACNASGCSAFSNTRIATYTNGCL